MKRTNRLLALLLAFALALTLLPAAAFAASTISTVRVVSLATPTDGEVLDFFNADVAGAGYSIDYDYYENGAVSGIAWYDRTEEHVCMEIRLEAF